MAWYSPGGTNFNTSYPGDSGKIIDLKAPCFLRLPSENISCSGKALKTPIVGVIMPLKDCNMLHMLKYPYYIPGTCLSSIFSFEPSKAKSFPIKTRVIWDPGIYISKLTSCKY